MPPRPRRSAWLLVPLALAAAAEEPKSGPIQDNSFLIEEAYNQEAGVVQHINTFQRMRRSKDWVYTFTQEWPVGGLKHQLSYTLPVTRVHASPDGHAGLGDVALNYRYQLLGDGDAALAVAPRVSVLLHTGDERQGRGAGATGLQFQLPLSWVVGERLVAHTNVGWTRTPKARDELGQRADLDAWNFGQSVVWLVQPRMNLLLEWAYSHNQTVAGPNAVATERTSFVSPGVRWAIDLPSGMQIVPGLAVPIGVGPSRHERSVFLYLSFEHPF